MTGTGISFENAGAATVARFEEPRVAGDLVDVLYKRLLEGMNVPAGRRFVLDLSKVTFLGSVGLTVIVVFLKRLKECGGELVLVGLNKQCVDVLTVMRFTEIIPIYGDVPAALAAMGA